MINAPKPNGKNNSSNTAVYGNKEGQNKNPEMKADDFGIKRLNGAMQLAKNGFKESSVVFAKETYRKYADSRQIPSYRIFFADILYEKGLYEEALGEYMNISKLELNNEEKDRVEKNIKSIVLFMAYPGPRQGRSAMLAEAPEKYMVESVEFIAKTNFFNGVEVWSLLATALAFAAGMALL